MKSKGSFFMMNNLVSRRRKSIICITFFLVMKFVIDRITYISLMKQPSVKSF